MEFTYSNFIVESKRSDDCNKHLSFEEGYEYCLFEKCVNREKIILFLTVFILKKKNVYLESFSLLCLLCYINCNKKLILN